MVTHLLSSLFLFLHMSFIIQMIKVTAIVLDNWASLYFLAIAIKTHFPQKRYLCKVACTVISLMNVREVPVIDGSEQSYDDAINTCDINSSENAALSGQYGQTIQQSESTFYVMLLFHRAFTDCAFNDSWRFLVQNDPWLGENTYGQGSRMMAERLVVMYNQVDELKKNDAWQNRKEFGKYMTAVNSIPDNIGRKGADKNFFLKRLPKEFFDAYCANMDKHFLKTWWASELVHYMIGGDPVLAKEFARMCVHYEKQYDTGTTINNEGEETNARITPYDYKDTPEMVTLGPHHVMFDDKAEPITLNVQHSMELITANVEWHKVVEDKFVKKHWARIQDLASADGVVNLFDVDKDGEFV